MRGSLASRRYAKSLLTLALEKGVDEAVLADMQLVVTTVSENVELRSMLKSPIVKSEKKNEILNLIFGSKVNALTVSFIKMATENGRENILGMIANSYILAHKKHNNIAMIEVTSAIALDQAQKDKILKLVASHGVANAEMTEKIDPSLIGGFIVRFGDQQIDASILRKFNNLKHELVNN